MKIKLYQMWRSEVIRYNLISLMVVALMDAACKAEGQFYLGILGGIYEICMSLFLVWYALNRLPDVYLHYKNGKLYEKILPSKNIRFEQDMQRAVIYRPLYQSKKALRTKACRSGVDTDYYIRSHAVFHEQVHKPRAGGGAQVVSRFQRIL